MSVFSDFVGEAAKTVSGLAPKIAGLLDGADFAALSGLWTLLVSLITLLLALRRARRGGVRFEFGFVIFFFFASLAVGMLGVIEFEEAGIIFDSIVEPIAVAACDFAALTALYAVICYSFRGYFELCAVETAVGSDAATGREAGLNRVRARPTEGSDFRSFEASKIKMNGGFQQAVIDPPVNYNYVLACLSRILRLPISDEEREEVLSARERVLMLCGSKPTPQAKRVLSESFMTAVRLQAKYSPSGYPGKRF